jgi:hypothetical protein
MTMIQKTLATALLVLVLGACAELGAERPLFSVADQGLPPLQEGIWIGVGEDCAEHNVRRRRFPQECIPLDIRREDDGAWRVQLRVDLVNNLSATEREDAETNPANGPFRVIIVPAVERALGDSFAPLYLAELHVLSSEETSVGYAVLAPIGEMPAAQMLLAPSISCSAILREGPLEGVEPIYVTRTDEQTEAEVRELDGCVASSQRAAREAARRAIVEDISGLIERRFVRVRGN